MERHKILLIIVLLIICFECYSQPRLDMDDSTAFKSAWIKFVNAINSKDANYIKQQSFSSVSCINCNSTDDDLNFCVPIDTFIHDAFKWGESSWFKAASAPGKFHIRRNSIYSYLPCNSKIQINRMYEVTFVTLQPNELEAGHEGAVAIYRFIKYKSKFMFYEMFTVP